MDSWVYRFMSLGVLGLGIWRFRVCPNQANPKAASPKDIHWLELAGPKPLDLCFFRFRILGSFGV